MAKKQKQPEPARSPRREAIGVILLALCLLSFFCVFSFHADDLSIFNDPPTTPPHNLIGPLGAWLAGISFILFGVGGYLTPFILLTGGLMMTLHSGRKAWPVWSWLAGALAAIASLFEYLSWGWVGSLTGWLNVGSNGGLIGQLFAVRSLGRWIGHAGAGIVFFTILFLAILQLTGMHPFTPFLFIWERITGLYGQLRKPAEQRTTSSVRNEKKKPSPLKQASEELFTPPTPVVAKAKSTAVPTPPPPPSAVPKPEPKPEPKPKPAPKKTAAVVKQEDDMSHVSVNIAPGVDESGYQLPPITLLDELPSAGAMKSTENTAEKAAILQATLEQFGVDGQVTHVETGPTVTSYEVTPAPGVRVEKISSLERNIALALRAQSIRIQAPIPGKGAVGIEIPNSKSSPVFLRQLAESKAFHDPDVALPLALGTDVSGKMIIGDLASMPHMLIAGATGAGKTVCMNSLLTGLLLSRTPEQMRMILVDPKTFEFQAYENLKHLVVPIITDAKKVTLGLRWAIKEMEKRYALFKKVKVRDIKSFNTRAIEKQEDMFGETPAPSSDVPAKLPYIVIVVDELAELMGVAQQEIEPCIVRLAQLSRAAGIHMILATQRPSVNVITGTIKANIPGRIAFQVAQGNDSRTILDTIGAEKLLGRGDMLYLPPGKSKPVRLQGTWTKDEEMNRITDFVRKQGAPDFITEITQKIESNKPAIPELDEDNELLEQAIEVIRTTKRASTSSLQRRLRIGYNRAANLMDLLEAKGIIGPPTETGPREILVDLDGEIPDNPTADSEPAEEIESDENTELSGETAPGEDAELNEDIELDGEIELGEDDLLDIPSSRIASHERRRPEREDA
jgi:S-DNA-T family DNA segregation ATPase FtsK/SpoIIIE